ncbi:MAG: phosphatidylserine decarboxylase [Clostridiales bacterium]|nr:phosphatidylserine decarboxylase [Clostridiales bacterium]
MSARHISTAKRLSALLLSIALILSFAGCRKNGGVEPTASPTVPPSPSATAATSSPATSTGHEPITEELITILEKHPEVKTLLEKSIDAAKAINPDKTTNPAQTLEEYYDYVDWAAKAMPWNISKNVDSNSLYTKIDQSLNYFYFINDQPLEELDGQGLYNNSLQYAEPYRSWLIKFTREWGEYLSTPDSWNDEYYQLFRSDPSFGLQEDWYESPENWSSFNEFFSRYLSDPGQRPIAAADDNSIITSPADSTPQGVWQIDDNSMIVQHEGVSIKSQTFNSISELIGPDSAYRDEFAGGVLTHTFLDVHDYHRYHFPVSGTVKEVTMIPQDDAIGGWVTWDAEKGLYVLTADVPGWQMIETRGCVIVETAEYGLVALLPVGMSQVSSVNFEDTVQVGAEVKKGDMLGYFLFGGSDFIMIFQKDAGFELTAPNERESEEYSHIFMGQEYGRFTGTPANSAA